MTNHGSNMNVQNSKVEYLDYARIQEKKEDRIAPSSKNSMNTFPVRLHYILSECEADGIAHIISWQPHGRCFLVHDPKEMQERVLPLWFQQTKYASFQRQLNIYGFKRITAGRDKNGYYHEMFLRGKGFLAKRIKRSKFKGDGPRKPSAPETEPNFYQMCFLPVNSKTQDSKLNNGEHDSSPSTVAVASVFPPSVATVDNGNQANIPTPSPNISSVFLHTSNGRAAGNFSPLLIPASVPSQFSVPSYPALLARSSGCDLALQQRLRYEAIWNLFNYLAATENESPTFASTKHK